MGFCICVVNKVWWLCTTSASRRRTRREKSSRLKMLCNLLCRFVVKGFCLYW